MKIALVTDTHLAARATDFNDNWQQVRHWLWQAQPDAIIHLGDISADGAGRADDLVFARRCFDDLPAPVHFLPGNHDIGDNPPEAGQRNDHPLDAARLADYQKLFGADRFSLHLGGWQLIGLNSLLLGSEDPQHEQAQHDWLAQALAAHREPLGVLLHKPLFEAESGEAPPHERYSPQPARQRLLALLAARQPRFVACGHAHQWRELWRDGALQVWTPSTSFCVPDALQPRFGDKCVGLLLLHLRPETFRFERITVDGLRRHNLLDFASVYPQLAALRARFSADEAAL